MASMTFYLNQGLGIEYKLSWIGGALFAILNNYFGSKYIVFKTTEQTVDTKFGFLSKLNFAFCMPCRFFEEHIILILILL